METINLIRGVVVGQYGSPVTLTVTDADGIAVDISSYATVSLKISSPDRINTLTFTGTLVGGGTTGQFSFTPTSANTFDRAGIWEGQARLTATDVLILSVPFDVEVSMML